MANNTSDGFDVHGCACLSMFDVKGHVGTAGVNPMITTESIAYMVGQGMAGKYRHLAGKRRGPVDIKYEEGKQ